MTLCFLVYDLFIIEIEQFLNGIYFFILDTRSYAYILALVPAQVDGVAAYIMLSYISWLGVLFYQLVRVLYSTHCFYLTLVFIVTMCLHILFYQYHQFFIPVPFCLCLCVMV